jgi:poly-gamma-glutamate capsule biosynthesis protein CapA/YwtB (metallophosphatase superfamily)
LKAIFSVALSLVLLLVGCTQSSMETGTHQQTPPPSQSELEPEPVPEPQPVVAHLMVAGDIMSHMPITKDAYVEATGAYDYSHLFQFAAQQLERADYAVANLETVLGGGPKYSGFPAFNSPDALAYGAKQAGFDLLSTANNHSRDQGLNGIYRTLDVLDQVGMAHVGTYRSQEELEENRGIYVADVGGVSVAFLSYTYGLNGFRLDSDKMYAVNLFNVDYYTTLANPDYDRIQKDLEAARALDTDLIAVMIHWGIEYQNSPNVHQTKLAEFLVEQGTDLVLGGHPHVLQPYETITVSGWDGKQREGFVCYSLGNFISNQYDPAPATMTTAVLDLELTRDPSTGETSVTDVGYQPYYMLHRDGAPVGERRYLVNIHQAIAEYEAGEHSLVDAGAYKKLKEALEHCHTILGEEGDLGWQEPLPEAA